MRNKPIAKRGEILDSLTERGYLIASHRYGYQVSPKALHELRPDLYDSDGRYLIY